MGADYDFIPTKGWEDLNKSSQINLLIDWDPVVDGYLPDLAIEWLSEVDIQVQERHQNQVGCAFDPPPRIDPEPPDLDNVGGEIPQFMPVLEEDDAPTGIDDVDPGQMEDSVKEHVTIHDHSVLASMPPFSDMRKEQ
eukprot:5158741-Ditylum_brightwellii.AAC.1